MKAFCQMLDFFKTAVRQSADLRLCHVIPGMRRLCAQLPFKRGQQYWRKRAFPVSAYTGEGLDALIEFLADDEEELKRMRKR